MSTNGILDFQNTNKIIFRGSDSNVVIDTSNVSLGIGIQGTETPGSNLHVVGNAFISSNLTVSGNATVSENLTVSGNVTVSENLTVSGNLAINNDTIGATSGVYWDDQNVRLGINQDNPLYTLHVRGNIYATHNITAFSDRRGKTNLIKIDNALNKISSLNGYTYNVNNQRSSGLIAQEIKEVLPEVVVGSEDTHYSVAYGNMMGLVVEAIKELKEKIDTIQG